MAVPVGRTDAPTSIQYGSSQSTMSQTPSNSLNTIAAGTYYINAASNAENLYINGSKLTSGQAYEFQVKAGEITYLRIITQDGIKEPKIKILRFTA